ncbi:hypothetical protein SAMN05216553_106115 [Lentzea fradiae]|uniref:Histone H1-like nucleoprotein HC2 n=1 Tax=Lentzea fradiae TaxID=200378 RepID=A0A1G7S913_9PSEU|nr:hypothetical protein [Lentzea fradiae]SDG19483.1 hypothetical protein SAMN05216553_106115 [Lentzea fradiae]
MAARGEAQADVEVSTLVVPAWRLRWRAPELALVLGERASALATARRDEADRLRAESLVVFAGNRVGRGVALTDRALDALKAAEAAGEHESAWLLRVELAACARSAGAPLTGFAAVAPVLEAPDVPAGLRASALVQASESLVTVGRGDEPTRALAEADQLYVADTSLDDDTRLVVRGLVRAVQAAQHRRWGDLPAAIGAAREGLDLVSRCTDPAADSGECVSRLTLELVLALLDANRLLEASEAGAAVLGSPVRAASASTTGWLRLALATRVHLPAGRVAQAREMLSEVESSAERHQLDTLLAESLLALAHVHEVSGELTDALANLRSAHAAERRRARAVYAVRARLAAEFSGVHRQPADLHQQLASLLRPVEGLPADADGVIPTALKQQLRQWRPVTVRKGDGVKANRVRRAAEDMTVEGLSAAQQHAADRWRVVQPFGDPEDKTPEPVEPPPAPSSSGRTVPASGLIASAGAMVSGRRRAARVAAGEIGDDTPTTIAQIPVITDDSEPPASAAQEPPAERPAFGEQRLTERPTFGEQRLAERPSFGEQRLTDQPSFGEQRLVEQSSFGDQRLAEQPPAAQSPADRSLADRSGAGQSGAASQSAGRSSVELSPAEQTVVGQSPVGQSPVEQSPGAHASGGASADQVASAEQSRLSPEQERKRKVEQQLMELQREARRQIEAERKAIAEQLAQAEREAAAAEEAAREEAARAEAARAEAAREEAARQEAARLEAAREAAAREEAARLEAAREEAARQEAAREEAARQEAAREEAARQEAAREEAAREEAARREAAREDAARREAARQQAARDATARLEAAREEVARQEAARREAARLEAVRRDVARQEAAHQEVARLAAEREAAAARAEAAKPQQESVLDMLKAQGLRAGGRRRARDPLAEPGSESGSDAQPGTGPSPEAGAAKSRAATTSDGTTSNATTSDAVASDIATSDVTASDLDAASASSTDSGPGSASATPSWRVEPPSRLRPDDPSAVPPLFSMSPGSGIPIVEPRSAPDQQAASAAPYAPDFGPHIDEPVYPLHTPAGGFPAADGDERKLPDLDFSSLDLSAPKAKPQNSPTPDLMSTSFLSSADVDDDSSDVPTVPVQVDRAPDQPSGDHTGPGTGAQAGFGAQPGFGAQTFGTQGFGTQGFGTQSIGGSEPGFGTRHTSDTPEPTAPPAPHSEPAAHVEPAAHPEPGALSGPSTPDVPAPSATADDPAGPPSSRRRPSEMSLADLLAEALVAYETGRRSDEDQVQAADLDAPEWAAVDPDAAGHQQAGHQPGGHLPGTPQAGAPGATGQPPAADPADQSDLYFGATQFGAGELGTPPTHESDQEKTGPIRPVGAAPDSETTGPIRPVGFDGPPGWTLPGV